MSTRAIIDVELNDAAWTKFQAQYKIYEAALASDPAAWKAVSKEIDSSRASFDNLVGAASARLVQSKLTADAEKVAADQLKRQTGETTTQARSWSSMAKDSKAFAGNIVTATKSLLRWAEVTGVISGLLGAGGLFGIDRMAQSVASQRKDASGIRATPGELRSFDLNFNRLLGNPSGFLTGVSESLSDVTKAAPYGALGLNYGQERNKRPADVAIDVLRAEKALADRTPQSQLGNVFASRQLGMLGQSVEDFQRIKDRPLAEILEYIKSNQGDRKNLDLSQPQLRAWEDFKVQLSRAGDQIEKTFIVALTPLAPQLGHLSKSVSGLVDAFLRNPETAHWLDEAADGIKTFATYIGTPEFKTDVDDLVKGIGDLAKSVGNGLRALGILPADNSPEAKKTWDDEETMRAQKQKIRDAQHPNSWVGGVEKRSDTLKNAPPVAPWGSNPFNLPGVNPNWISPTAYRPTMNAPVANENRASEAHDFFRAAGWSEAQTAGLIGNGVIESGLNPGAFNPAGGGQGAQGAFQWRGDRIDNFRRMFGHDPRHGPYEEQLMFVQWELTHTEKRAGDHLRAYQGGAAGAGDLVNREYERSGTNSGARSRTSEQYAHKFKDRSVQVQIHNNTGGTPT